MVGGARKQLRAAWWAAQGVQATLGGGERCSGGDVGTWSSGCYWSLSRLSKGRAKARKRPPCEAAQLVPRSRLPQLTGCGHPRLQGWGSPAAQAGTCGASAGEPDGTAYAAQPGAGRAATHHRVPATPASCTKGSAGGQRLPGRPTLSPGPRLPFRSCCCRSEDRAEKKVACRRQGQWE